MRRTLALLLLPALLVVAATSLRAGDDPAAALPRWKPGEQEGTVSIDDKPEKFTALVPAGYSPKKPAPTVILVHGNGDTAANFLHGVRTFAGKTPPLLIALERCDNQQKAEGYVPKYLEALRTQFAIEDGKLFLVGFSGGGFRSWDDVVCQAEVSTKFRGIVLVGSARQNLDPPDKPEKAPSVVLVGDPKDSNFKETGPAAEKALKEKGYEVIVLEHGAGHSMPPAEMRDVFAWIQALIDGKKTTLVTRRVGEETKPPKKK